MSEKTKYIIIVLGSLTFTFIFIMAILGAGASIEVENNETCEKIGMEFLSRTEGAFKNNVVVCYDKLNNETREIPI